MAGFCEHGNEPLASIKVEYVCTNYDRLKEDDYAPLHDLLTSSVTPLSKLFFDVANTRINA
jgi:hypothetical protein